MIEEYDGMDFMARIPPSLFFALVTMTLCLASCVSEPNPIPTPFPTPPATPPATFTVHPDMLPTDSPALDMVKGSFRNQIRALEENMPREKSQAYIVPTEKEQADFARLVAMLGNNDLAGAADLAAENHYRLTYYEDRGDDHALNYLLRENRPVEKGWGLYAFRVGSTRNIIVEAPHPLYDRRTSSVALDIYRALDARALLIAGAHRNANRDGSADVAHAPESIFQTVHETLVQEVNAPSGDLIILQIHGFHTSKHDGYPQAVFGFGEKTDPLELALAKRLEEAFAEQKLTLGLCIGEAWRDLCGRMNIQAATSHSALFIHIELDEKIRKNDKALIAALLQVFAE